LQTRFTAPLETALLDNTPDTQICLLDFYTNLLRHWTTLLLGSPPSHAEATVSSLMAHVDILALTVSQTSPTLSAHSSIIAFYEAASDLFSHRSLCAHVRISPPPSTLIYTLFFSQRLPVLSRLCAVLAAYKRAFEFATSQAATRIEYDADSVKNFNGVLMDICNCIWRGRAFNATDPSALGCLMSAEQVAALAEYVRALDGGLGLATLLNVSCAPALCLQSVAFVRSLEAAASLEAERGHAPALAVRHHGPVTQQSLKRLRRDGGLSLSWSEYRLGMLGWLAERGGGGVGELMQNTMKNLMTGR
jgi:centromere protein I